METRSNKYTKTQESLKEHDAIGERLTGKGGFDWVFLGGMALLFIGYVLIHDILGGTLLEHNEWDSYSLQTEAWLQGSTALGKNYTWLELGYFNGDWYVPFPMTPSIFLIPVVAFTGADTPNNLIIIIYTIATTAFAYQCFKKVGTERVYAMFLAIVFVQGSNMMWMSTMGSVWFQAQALNLLLCFAAIYCLLAGKNALCMFLLALAIGCRPFSIVLFFAVLVYIVLEERKKHPHNYMTIFLLRQCRLLVLPAIVACIYLYYNYIRFGNVLDFGRGYLQELIDVDGVEFSLPYFLDNVQHSLFGPITINADGSLSYTSFNGFLFFVANPIFVVWFISIVQDIYYKRMTTAKAILIAAWLANLIMLLSRLTMGGWQFGNRYLVDLIPYVLLYILLNGEAKPSGPTMFIGTFAVIFNVYGAFAIHFREGLA